MSLEEVIGLLYELAGEEFNGMLVRTDCGFVLRFEDGGQFGITVKDLSA